MWLVVTARRQFEVYFLVSEEENYRLYVFTLAIWSKVDDEVGGRLQ